MLIEFSIGNFKSFKDIQTFSMVAAPIVSKFKEVDKTNVIAINSKISLLKSKAIYGANASGKSNLIRAMSVMQLIVQKSLEKETILQELLDEFQLNTDNKNQPGFFQIVFILNNVRYRYGFEVARSSVVSEWLFAVYTKTETQLFVRDNDTITVNSKQFKEAKGLEVRTRSNALFLTVCKAFNVQIAEQVGDYFTFEIGTLYHLTDASIRELALKCLEHENVQTQVQQLLQVADFGINYFRNVTLNKDALTSIPEELRLKLLDRGNIIATERIVFNGAGEPIAKVWFDLANNDSQGTIKMLYLSALLLQGLSTGKTMFIDELGDQLHPLLTRRLIQLFNSDKTNSHNAQLIFVTHDPTLLDAKLLRRDQVCLVEKDKYGASSLQTLAEYKGVRNDASFEKDYLKGKYGAVPFLGDFESIFETAS